jgi:shikimate dehydrogenase
MPALPLTLTATGAFDLVVDATPGVGLDGIEIAPGGVAFDLKYGAMATPLLRAARARGVQAVDGLPMLIAQAIATYEIWYRDGRPFERAEHQRLMDGLLTHLGGDA